jgi:hypothetical protein
MFSPQLHAALSRAPEQQYNAKPRRQRPAKPEPVPVRAGFRPAAPRFGRARRAFR